MSHRYVSIVLAAALAVVSVACQPTGTGPVNTATAPTASPAPVRISLVQGNVLAPKRVVASGDGDAVKADSGQWISTNTGNVISTGGGNFIGTNTGSVISTGGGNVISTGGGNVISTGGGNVISTGGGNVISTGGGNVISTGGGNFIGTNTGNFIPGAIGKVISTGGGNVISTGGGNVISTGGGNVISTGGGNVISTGGGNVISTGGGNYRTQAETHVDSEPVVGAEVFLADLQGKPLPGFQSSITDPEGHYQIPDVPRGLTFIVVVRVIVKRKVKGEEAEEASLVTIGASPQENNRIDVTLATTYTTAALYARAAEAAKEENPKPFVITPELLQAVEDVKSAVENAVKEEVEDVKDTLLGDAELEEAIQETFVENKEIQEKLERLIAIAKEPEKAREPESPPPSDPPPSEPPPTEPPAGDEAVIHEATQTVEIKDGAWEYPASEQIEINGGAK